MSKNAQILLESLIEQEFQNNDNYSSISDYFEFFSASQILKNQGLSTMKQIMVLWEKDWMEDCLVNRQNSFGVSLSYQSKTKNKKKARDSI